MPMVRIIMQKSIEREEIYIYAAMLCFYAINNK